MCGIAGKLKLNASVNPDALHRMIATLRHRGPDDQSFWHEEGIGLAHARLSIQDLSSVANQPMCSLSRRFVIVFNGEIYNYLELRDELARTFSIQFKTHGDTEVLVNAIEFWGIEKTLKQCVGMFAFAVWDRREKRLCLARDRFGEKPLYYGVLGNDFVFSSELKAIRSAYKDKLNLNRDALATYMQFCYVPTPFSIFSEINKLKPGTFLTVKSDFSSYETEYWSTIQVAQQKKVDISFSEAVNELEKKLKHTLSQQMLSDVPLGAFLSGGVDSSTVVALMQSLSNRPIKTFSIGFSEKAYDESAYAKAVANHLKTDHTELIMTDKNAMDVIHKLAYIYDEPFADSSQIPTFLVSQLAKKSVTVALSGDAGDEIFGGYGRYFLAHKVKLILGNPVVNKLLKLCPEGWLDLFDYIPQNQVSNLSHKLKKVKYIANELRSSFVDMYQGFCSHPHQNFVLNSNRIDVIDRGEYKAIEKSFSDIEMMMLIDTLNYLADDILVKVDRAAMAVSLETRVPFLDHRIFEFAWSLPQQYKVSSRKGKLVLRELLYHYVPKSLIDRPKMGFGIPLGEWLKGRLRDWAEDLLSENRLKQQELLDHNIVRNYWQEHKQGKRNHQYLLWNILMFQQWFELYG